MNVQIKDVHDQDMREVALKCALELGGTSCPNMILKRAQSFYDYMVGRDATDAVGPAPAAPTVTLSTPEPRDVIKHTLEDTDARMHHVSPSARATTIIQRLESYGYTIARVEKSVVQR